MADSDWLPKLPIADSTGAYSIVTGGHLYGAHENKRSIYPAASFLAHLDEVRAAQPDAFIALGDIVRGGCEMDEVHAFGEVVAHLGTPFFNALGNHDQANECLAPSFLKPINKAFFISTDLLLILHTESLLGASEDDLARYVGEVKEAVGEEKVRNLLVFTHRNVPAVALPTVGSCSAVGRCPAS